MIPKPFIFDLDGTLVDSLQDIADALNRALADFGLPIANLDSVRGWIGGGLRTLCQRACSDAHFHRLDELILAAEKHYQDGIVVNTRPYRNILEMLHLLKDRGTSMAVFSNKPHALTVEVIHRLEMEHFFSAIHGPESEELRKPSPHTALKIANLLGAVPEGVFFVGDSAVDVETARNAGMISVGVTWGFRPVEELVSSGANFLVNDPLEIVKL